MGVSDWLTFSFYPSLHHPCHLKDGGLDEDRFVLGPAAGEGVAAGKWVILETHYSGEILTRRGSDDDEPYVSGTFSWQRPGLVRFEWRLANCPVGEGTGGFVSVLKVDGRDVGRCTWPLCRAEVQDPRERLVFHVEVFYTPVTTSVPQMTTYGARMILPRAYNESRLRVKRTLGEPLASHDGGLLLADVVYSSIDDQIVIFGPSPSPLGGLFCEWDKNPQTCEPPSCQSKLKCHSDRIPMSIRKSLLWQKTDIEVLNGKLVPGQDGLRFECVFKGTWGTRSLPADLLFDLDLSLNGATCTPPPQVRDWLLKGFFKGGVEIGGEKDSSPPSLEFRSVNVRDASENSSVKVELGPSTASQVHERLHSLSICAIFRDQAPYLAEWIEYHLLLGIEHFYLYDHQSIDAPINQLAPYIERGIVDLHQVMSPRNRASQI